MNEEPKYKLYQWVFVLGNVECIKIWGVRYKRGDGVRNSSGWYYYGRNGEWCEQDLTDSFEYLKEYTTNKLCASLNSAQAIKKESEK